MSEGVTLEDIKGRVPSEARVMAFGKGCRVVELSPAGSDEIQAFIRQFEKDNDKAELDRCITVIWVAFCMLGDAGKRIIPNDAIRGIASQSGNRDFRRLFKVVAKLNGLIDEEDESGNP